MTLSALIENGESGKALQLYQSMQIKSDLSLHRLSLKACRNCNDLKSGEWIIESNKLHTANGENSEDFIRLKTTLIDFYGHFKQMSAAQNVFDATPNNLRDAACINAMIKAYGSNECMQSAHNLFSQYRHLANKQTFVILLSGYSHSGDGMEEAVKVWEHQIERRSIKYDLLIMTALIDGLARRGFVYSAYEYAAKYNKFHKITKHFDDVMYTSLLSGCRDRKNKLLAQFIAKQIRPNDMSQNRKVSIDRLLSNT